MIQIKVYTFEALYGRGGGERAGGTSTSAQALNRHQALLNLTTDLRVSFKFNFHLKERIWRGVLFFPLTVMAALPVKPGYSALAALAGKPTYTVTVFLFDSVAV